MVPGARKPTVVVADDDYLIRFVLRAALERAGFRVLDAEDGDAVLRIAHSEPVDAIVLDARMPGHTLSDTLGALRAERSDLPVLVLSGQVEPPEEAAAAHTDFLSKPVDSTELIATVTRLVGIGAG